jgi:hypothetical protein
VNECGEMGAQTHKLVEDAFIFTPENRTVLQCVHHMHSRYVHSTWIHSASRSIAPADMGKHPITLVVSTSGGVCGEQYFLKMLVVRFPKR